MRGRDAMHGMTEASRLQAGKMGSSAIAVVAAASLLLAGCGAPRSGNAGGTGSCPPPPAAGGPEQQVHLLWQKTTNDWMVQLGGATPVKPAAAHTPLPRCTGPTKFVVDVIGNSSATFVTKGGGLDVWEGNNAKSQWKKGVNTVQILGPDITDDGKLVFYDLNQGNPVTLNYQLNFNNGVKSVDPIMDNGGSN